MGEQSGQRNTYIYIYIYMGAAILQHSGCRLATYTSVFSDKKNTFSDKKISSLKVKFLATKIFITKSIFLVAKMAK